jgi:hypothetical protein
MTQKNYKFGKTDMIILGGILVVLIGICMAI